MRIAILFFILTLAAGVCDAQWVQTPLDSVDVRCFAVSGTNLFAGTARNGVFLSTNNGTNWTPVDSGLVNLSITTFNALAVMGLNLFAGTNGTGVFLSTNSGISWAGVGPPLPDRTVFALAVSGTDLFAGLPGLSFPGGIYRSTNNGTSWVNAGLFGYGVYALAVLGTNLFAGTSPGGVFRTTNNGTNWTAVDTGLTGVVITFAVSGTNLFAGTYNSGVFRTTNNGTSWTHTNLVNPNVRALAISDTNLFAGAYGTGLLGGGVFLSTNNGTNWTAVSTGLTNDSVQALAVSGSNLFAGTAGGVWRRPLSEMITSVEPAISELPNEFMLEQNYPNPFNPVTNFQFSTVNRQLTILKVLDVLGREVATLLNEEKPAGAYTVQWDASGVASGVYFYRLKAGNIVDVKKLILLR